MASYYEIAGPKELYLCVYVGVASCVDSKKPEDPPLQQKERCPVVERVEARHNKEILLHPSKGAELPFHNITFVSH